MTTLCTYSESTHLAHDILPTCPLSLTRAEHAYCGCARREHIEHGRISLRVLTCTHPHKWNGDKIVSNLHYSEAIRKLAARKLAEAKQQSNEREDMPTETKQEAKPQPLWPKKLPVIGGTGKRWAGKTFFGLSISPRSARVYDLEKSSETYEDLEGFAFTRVDVPTELLRVYPNGHTPMQFWEWWLADVRKVKPGDYRVIMVDPINDLESGLTAWVEKHPAAFGRNPGDYRHKGYQTPTFWGDVKEYWKRILNELASRCDTFYFTTHLTNVWVDGKPTSKEKPKGKVTLEELASLYLRFERTADAKGNMPKEPAGIVLKDRLLHSRYNEETGEIETRPVLPPRIPVCTPKRIRDYMLSPPDYSKLKADERYIEKGMSEEELLELKARTEEARSEATANEVRKLELEEGREERKRLAAEAQAAKAVKPRFPIEQTPVPQPETAPAPTPAPQPPARPSESGDGNARPDQGKALARLAEIRQRFFESACADKDDEARKNIWLAILAKRGVTTARDLDADQLDELIDRLTVIVHGNKEPQKEAQPQGEAPEQPAGDQPADGFQPAF